MNNADMPAYPQSEFGIVSPEGLTKREYFAAMAMQGLLANDNGSAGQYYLAAIDALKHADAILKELEK